jgi:hypothetical protein
MWAVPAKIGPSGTLKCSTINYEAPPTFFGSQQKRLIICIRATRGQTLLSGNRSYHFTGF